MRKLIKPERVAGIVALSYLVLIPAGAYLFHRRVQMVEKNIEDLWYNLNEDAQLKEDRLA
jgi:hypothetical protein